MTEKEKASISVSFCLPLSLSLYLLFNLSNVNQKNDKKIHLDEKEKSALLFCVYVRSPIDNYENKKHTEVMEWTFISFARSVSSQLIVFRSMFRRQTDIHQQWSTERKFYQSLSYSTVTDERILPNCHSYDMILICCWLFFSLPVTLFLLLYLPAWLRKHRASIDSSQIIMTSIHYSSSHSLSLPTERQDGDASGRSAVKKRRKKRMRERESERCAYESMVGLVRVELKISTFRSLQ